MKAQLSFFFPSSSSSSSSFFSPPPPPNTSPFPLVPLAGEIWKCGVGDICRRTCFLLHFLVSSSSFQRPFLFNGVSRCDVADAAPTQLPLSSTSWQQCVYYAMLRHTVSHRLKTPPWQLSIPPPPRLPNPISLVAETPPPRRPFLVAEPYLPWNHWMLNPSSPVGPSGLLNPDCAGC